MLLEEIYRSDITLLTGPGSDLEFVAATSAVGPGQYSLYFVLHCEREAIPISQALSEIPGTPLRNLSENFVHH